MDFSRQSLDQAGFGKWNRIGELSNGTLPDGPGVYLVRYPRAAPSFTELSCGGWFKGRDPTVARESLDANWVTGTDIVYIGKANNLRRRIRELARFGQGHAIGHWGGRLMWQLEAPEELEVSWLETTGRDPYAAETEMITAFRSAFGKPPFANDPHRLGG
ncbi:GIY-YIG nuclease family protein [Tsuneonella troitsensis]|uniref:GIY-YIG nuclease family protein n=1 Tax=Tsuneonella troitsensis TaxID=292222 RepID=UPI00070AC072|nr:GIY-YIG nuclease family protein [Tsuneonella troitsensis]